MLKSGALTTMISLAPSRLAKKQQFRMFPSSSTFAKDARDMQVILNECLHSPTHGQLANCYVYNCTKQQGTAYEQMIDQIENELYF